MRRGRNRPTPGRSGGNERMMITEAILDQAIEAAERGLLNCWCGCGTACCVLGFARHLAGLPERRGGPQPGEIEDTPRAQTIARLMCCGSPDILRVMRAVRPDGSIHLAGANLAGVDLGWANLSNADLSGADLSNADLALAYLRGANLSAAKLSGANLSGAKLSAAKLSGANLSNADLAGAN